jgi:uncharacterized protein
VWREHPDRVLSLLCNMLVNRHLLKTEISSSEPNENRVQIIRDNTEISLEINQNEVSYFVFTDVISNRAYNTGEGNSTINILMKNNETIDIAKASDLSNLESLDKTVTKHILCYPRII